MSQKYLSQSNREDHLEISLDHQDESSHEIQVEALDYSNMEIEEMAEKYEMLRKQNVLLSDAYSKASKEIQKEKEGSNQKLLQAETMGMMTKYQLVFVKMETAFAKVFNHNKIRELRKLQEAFAKFKLNTLQKRLNIVCGAKVALENYKGLGKVFRLYERTQKLNMKDAFHTWKTSITAEKVIKEKKQLIDEEINEKRSESKRLERKIKEVEVEIKEVDKEYNKFEEDKERLEQQKGIPTHLRAEINQILGTPSGFVSDQAIMNQLQMALEQSTMVNRQLTKELENTNGNVKSFITDMSTLISSNQLASMDIEEPAFEECGGSSFYNDQREEYAQPTKKYTPHYHTATQGGTSHGRRKRKGHK